jgi:hypothetical protein
MRRAILAASAVMAMLALTGAAYADSCANVSRAPAACGFSCANPVSVGNWVWLPSIGVQAPAWGFSPPSKRERKLHRPERNRDLAARKQRDLHLGKVALDPPAGSRDPVRLRRIGSSTSVVGRRASQRFLTTRPRNTSPTGELFRAEPPGTSPRIGRARSDPSLTRTSYCPSGDCESSQLAGQANRTMN